MTISLDKIDRKILFELDKNARIPETRLAKIIGRSKESVRYRIKKLEAQGIIKGFTTWIDPTKLGYITAKIYITLSNRPDQKKRFIEYAKKDKRLFWLGIAEGAWNAGLTYFVQSPEEFFDLKNELFSAFQDLILDSHTGTVVNAAVHDKTFFVPAETSWMHMFGSPERYELDDVEKSVIKELFINARTSIVDIARKHDTTVDIVRNRMKRLEERKIIARYLAVIDYSALGYEFYKTFLYFKNLAKKDENRLMEYARQHPNIIHIVKQISPWDIELEILCENYLTYNKIIAELTQQFAETIHKVETAIMSEDYVFPSKKMVFE